MTSIFIIVTSLMIIVVVWFIGFCMGQSRMARMDRQKYKQQFIHIQTLIDKQKPYAKTVDHYINAITLVQLNNKERFK